jgi:HNH endonuclease
MEGLIGLLVLGMVVSAVWSVIVEGHELRQAKEAQYQREKLESQLRYLREHGIPPKYWRFPEKAIAKWGEAVEDSYFTHVEPCYRRHSGQPPDWHWRRHFVLERDGKRCVECKRPGYKVALHIHHVTPQVFGGDHDLDNLVALCVRCHRKKHGKGWMEDESRVCS